MTTKLIEIEADALEGARQQAKSQIPKGLSMLSEEVISDGKPKILKSIAETKEIAYAKAQNEVPKDANILEKKGLVAPEQKIVIVEAFDEQSARIQAGNQSGNTAIIKSIKTVTLGSKGFLGIGKKTKPVSSRSLSASYR